VLALLSNSEKRHCIRNFAFTVDILPAGEGLYENPQIWPTTKACDCSPLKVSNNRSGIIEQSPKRSSSMKPISDLAKNKDKQRRSWQAPQAEQKDDQGPHPTVLEITSHNLKPGHAEARFWSSQSQFP